MISFTENAKDSASGNFSPPQQVAHDVPVAADPPDDPMVPANPVPPLLLNLRDRKLHRVASRNHVACGATLPKRWRFLTSRDDEPRAKLCLRNGCFSPGACV